MCACERQNIFGLLWYWHYHTTPIAIICCGNAWVKGKPTEFILSTIVMQNIVNFDMCEASRLTEYRSFVDSTYRYTHNIFQSNV